MNVHQIPGNGSDSPGASSIHWGKIKAMLEKRMLSNKSRAYFSEFLVNGHKL